MARNENRGSVRVKRMLGVSFRDGEVTRRGTTVNLSMEGMCIQSDHLLMTGTVFDGLIQVGTTAIRVAAVVRWTKKASGRSLAEKGVMGLQLIGAPGEAYRQIVESGRAVALGNRTIALRALAM
jgi:hypothetical protein